MTLQIVLTIGGTAGALGLLVSLLVAYMRSKSKKQLPLFCFLDIETFESETCFR